MHSQDYNSDYVELLKEVDGEEVIYKKESLKVIMQRQSFCGMAILPITMHKEKENSYEKEKQLRMKCDYPEIVEKLSLLLSGRKGQSEWHGKK